MESSIFKTLKGRLFPEKNILFIIIIAFWWFPSFAQQNVEFHIDAHLFTGKEIIKIKRDFSDEFLWVLAKNNEVYRLNTITKVIDDYTSFFSAYNHLNFIDIAGFNKNQVFIATKNSVLQLKNNTIKVIGAAEGLLNEVNSIGIEFSTPLIFPQSDYLLIATDLNYYTYRIATETIFFEAVNARSEIYEASFNKFMYTGTTYASYGTDLTYVPVVFKSVSGTFVQHLWKDNNFYGQNIKTAYYTYGDISPAYHVPSLLISDYSNLFWGNEKGLFQVNRGTSWSTQWPGKSYLSGKQVNKISSIYGLSTFGREGYFNPLLIRENLLVGTDEGLYYSTNIYMKYSMGPLHDFTLQYYSPLGNLKINDICINHTSIRPLCENGAWLATVNGLYFLKPDYSSFVSTQILRVAQFKNQINISETEICTGGNVTAEIEFGINDNGIQWYKDGNPINAASNRELNITAPGEYWAVLYNNCSNVSVKTNTLKVKTIDVPEVALNYPDQISLCKGIVQTLSTVLKPNYIYRWYRNNVLIANQTTNSYNVISTGTYKVEVSSCSGSWLPSKEVEIIYENIPKPLITTDKHNYCQSDYAQLSIAMQQDYNIKWFRNGSEVQSYAGNHSISTNTPGTYTAVYSSLAGCTESSLSYNLVFNTPSVFTIGSNAGTKLCYGEQTTLTASIAATSYIWSTGESTRSIVVNRTGKYSVQAVNDNGCSSTAEIDIEVFPALQLNQIPDAKICTFTGEELIVNAESGYKTYTWNGQTSNSSSFKINSPGNYQLVVTNENGCTASTNFKVIPWCTEVIIPNAFSPNGDGINDTWNIAGIEGKTNTRLSVYNRYGVLVYQLKGEFKGWDGRNANTELPVGTYYYILYNENNKTPIKGSVNIIR